MESARPRRGVAVDFLALALACGAGLLPFVAKPYNIDDPLFLWAARHIARHPADFFGFDVNWYGTETPMSQVTRNPPLTCYYAAGVGALFGWGEAAMHVAFFPVAVAALWGTYRLAELFGARPLLAALAALTTPAFLVSSTTVMCDVMMVALWVWAVVLWERGLRAGRPAWLLAAGGLIVACALTKYYGLCLIPLLGAYSLAARRPWRQWVPPLLLAALGLVGYQFLTRHMYGQGLLTAAITHVTSQEPSPRGNVADGLVTLLAFTGGGVGAVLFFGPWLWARRATDVQAVTACAAFVLLVFALARFDAWAEGLGYWAHPGRLGYAVQVSAWGTAGVLVVGLAAADLYRRRDAGALLLALWVVGTTAFAGFVNWSLNGRSILPLVPPVAVILARHPSFGLAPSWRAWLPLAPAAALALSVTAGDAALATANRRAAERAVAEPPGGTVWFQGHWGFQYYLQELGARPWDVLHPERARAGDRLLVPLNNSPLYGVPRGLRCSGPRQELFGPAPWVTTMNSGVGAGFYSDVFGHLPFYLGAVPDEGYDVYDVLPEPEPGPG
jgi:4-amino-4-deoxy-L-arabinose transferase-like glycosyltransferase